MLCAYCDLSLVWHISLKDESIHLSSDVLVIDSFNQYITMFTTPNGGFLNLFTLQIGTNKYEHPLLSGNRLYTIVIQLTELKTCFYINISKIVSTCYQEKIIYCYKIKRMESSSSSFSSGSKIPYPALFVGFFISVFTISERFD